LAAVTAWQDLRAGGVDDSDVVRVSGRDVDDYMAGHAVDLELGVELITRDDELLSGLNPEVLAERLQEQAHRLVADVADREALCRRAVAPGPPPSEASRIDATAFVVRCLVASGHKGPG
jgi:hypothetical protein